ncbi:MAG: hypothetical protein DMG22_16070 [Acidobacteria bacterium]|nr:MAG: hypothetical protein DMG22_16070 [Acidobacteriota bacterium]
MEKPARSFRDSPAEKCAGEGEASLSSVRGSSNRKSKCPAPESEVEGNGCDPRQRQLLDPAADLWCMPIGQVLGIRAPAAFTGQASWRQHAREPQHAAAPMPGNKPDEAARLMHPRGASNTSALIRRRIPTS